MAALFALVDCNNFYASCERLFEPRLRGKPVVVLSNNDGCVIARSNEAKALGIGMGEPWHLNKQKFAKAGVVVRSSNYTLYGDISARVMIVLKSLAPGVEVYSIDEAFLDLNGIADCESFGRHVRESVFKWTGIPVSVGIAPSKTLAKVANHRAKKVPEYHGVCGLLDVNSQIDALEGLALDDLWGVAGRMASRLERFGIVSPLALRGASSDAVRAEFGVVMERMVHELNGISCSPLVQVVAANKSIVASRSFGKAVTSPIELMEAVSSHVERAGEKLRRQGLCASTIRVFVMTNRFKPDQPQYYGTRTVHLPVSTADSARLLAAARHCLRKIWRTGYSFKKAGVELADLVPRTAVQGSLWSNPDTERREALMKAVDGLNNQLGRNTVHFASTGVDRSWRLRCEHRSNRFTTSWEELLEVG